MPTFQLSVDLVGSKPIRLVVYLSRSRVAWVAFLDPEPVAPGTRLPLTLSSIGARRSRKFARPHACFGRGTVLLLLPVLGR